MLGVRSALVQMPFRHTRTARVSRGSRGLLAQDKAGIVATEEHPLDPSPIMTKPSAPIYSPGHDPAQYLDIPDERRAAAATHVATLSETARRVALGLPIQCDVDDFRRVLVASAPSGRVTK